MRSLVVAALALVLFSLLSGRSFAGSNWIKVAVDNSAVFALDLSSVRPFPSGGMYASVCLVDHHRCDVMNRRTLLFDCDGHYKDLTNLSIYTPVQLAPARSVIGRIAAIVCAHGKSLSRSQ